MTAINKDIVVALNEAWDRLVSVIGIRQSNDLKLGDLVSGATTGPLDLYVETWGNDANDGSALRPFKTIQAAVDVVPKTIKHPTRIQVGSGNFAGARIEELSVDGSTFTLAAMRAATPKYCTNATIAITGTKVWGD